MHVHADEKLVVHGAFMPALASSDDADGSLLRVGFLELGVGDLVRVGPREFITCTDDAHALLGC